MTARPKFLFDVDFAEGDPTAKSEPMITVREHTAAQADAEARGYRAGFAAGEAKAAADDERRAAMALERVAAGIEALFNEIRGIEGRLEAEAVEVAVAVARKLTPELIAREPLAEIAALASECFRELIAAPHVVVRVSEALHAVTRERLEATARLRGFEGRLVVLAEPDLAPGDCRIEWADGGMVRNRAATELAIGEVVARYIAVRRDPPAR